MERSEASAEEKCQRLHWHPAFYAGMQIELQDEADKLSFQKEYMLGEEPMRMDIPLTKKNKNTQVEQNIGPISRNSNIIEYKSPTAHLSIDDFYPVYPYASACTANRGK